MIFVTVGSTHFDPLIERIDHIAGLDKGQQYICQIGSGKYIPRYCEYFRTKSSIDSEINNAELVVTHGGATVFQLLKKNKRFIAVPNKDLAGDHQSKFLQDLMSELPLYVVEFVSELSVDDMYKVKVATLIKNKSISNYIHKLLN